MMEPLKVAVIGAGSHARGHFEMIANEPRTRLVAIAELDASRLEDAATQHRPDATYTDYRRMLDECDIDIVYVITMPGHLKPIVLDCLERNIHVSVEKSPGLSSDDTVEMAEAARSSEAKAIVSLNRRYFPEVLAVRQIAREHGGAIHVSATYNKILGRHGTTLLKGLSPDPIVWDAIHHVDLIRWLAGPSHETAATPVEVYSEVLVGDRPAAHRHNAVVKFDSGAIGTLMSHFGVGSRIQRADIHAEDFSAYLELTRGRQVDVYEATRNPDGTTDGSQIDGPLDLTIVGGADFNETTHFVDCIVNDTTPWSSLDDAVITMRLWKPFEQVKKGHSRPSQ